MVHMDHGLLILLAVDGQLGGFQFEVALNLAPEQIPRSGIAGSLGASQVVLMVKNLPAMQETWVQSLSWKDPLEKGMATPSSILAWRIPWTEEPGGLQSMGLQRVRHN